MVSGFNFPFWVDENVRNVLGVSHLLRPATHLQERVVLRGPLVGRIEEKAMREARAKAGCELPVLAFDVVDDCAMRPCEKRWNDEPNALARPRWRECHDMLGSGVAQIVV